jgi:hypothetical protein
LSQEGAQLEVRSERRLELGPQRGDVNAHGWSSAGHAQECRLALNGYDARCGRLMRADAQCRVTERVSLGR